MRLIPNWKHFSNELKVDVNVINRLEQYADFSPTIRLFEYLETAQPNLSIQQLKQAFLDIRRNDLFSLLTRTGLPLCDVSVVLTPWTARNHPFKSPGGGGGGYSGFQVTGTGFEIFDSGFFVVVKFGKYFVGWPALSRNFFGNLAWDFFWFLYLAQFDHPCHLKSEVPHPLGTNSRPFYRLWSRIEEIFSNHTQYEHDSVKDTGE